MVEELPIWPFINVDHRSLPDSLAIFIEFAHLFGDLERVYAQEFKITSAAITVLWTTAIWKSTFELFQLSRAYNVEHK